MIKRISYFVVLAFVLLLGINNTSASTEYCKYAGVWLGGQYATKEFEVTISIDTSKIDKGDKYEVYKTKGSGQTAQSLAVVNYYKQDADLGVSGYFDGNIVDLGNYYKKNGCPSHIAIYDYTGSYGGYVTIPYSKTYNSKGFDHTILAKLDNQEINATKSMNAKTICKSTKNFEYNLGFDDKGNLVVVTDKKGDKLDYFKGEFNVTDAKYCPKDGEITVTRETRDYQIPGSTKYTPIEAPVFRVTSAYRDRLLNEIYIICTAVNDMQNSFVFDKATGKGMYQISKNLNVKDLLPLPGEAERSDWTFPFGKMNPYVDKSIFFIYESSDIRVNNEKQCPTHNNETTSKKAEVTVKSGWWIFSKTDTLTISANKIVNVTKHYKSRIEKETGKYDIPDDGPDGCSSYKTISTCTNSSLYSCLWVDKTSGKISTKNTNGYCNVDNLQYVQCGGAFDIPAKLPGIISFVINILKIATPIILIFTSAITLLKAITASKEDEMTKARATMFKRIGIAAMIFFTITITQFVIDKVADDSEAKDVSSCMNCFINNRCETNKYYKNNINGEYKCYSVSDGKEIKNCH